MEDLDILSVDSLYRDMPGCRNGDSLITCYCPNGFW